MKSKWKALIVLILAVLMVAIWEIREINISGENDKVSDIDNTQLSDKENNKTDEAVKKEGTKLTLIATGDNFMHDSVIESGKQPDGTYNYDYIFKGIKKYLDEADIAVINQASVIGGNELGVAGYPDFNAPEEICDAIKNAGFDVVLMASNRVNSMGTGAIASCIDIWKERAEDIKVLGIKKEEADSDYAIIEVKGIKIAMLNYTYGLNTGISADKMYMVNTLGACNEVTGEVSQTILSSKVLNQIKTADEAVDFVIVFPCWGNEYEYVPSDIQTRFAEQMIEAGADLIIGTHPHYLEKVEQITADNGNMGLCYYSLGNLISSQNYTGSMLGGLAKVTLAVENGRVVIDEDNTGLIPVVTHYTYSGVGDLADMKGVIPFSEYTKELAEEHGISERGGVDFSLSELQYILNTFIDEKYILD